MKFGIFKRWGGGSKSLTKVWNFENRFCKSRLTGATARKSSTNRTQLRTKIDMRGIKKRYCLWFETSLRIRIKEKSTRRQALIATNRQVLIKNHIEQISKSRFSIHEKSRCKEQANNQVESDESNHILAKQKKLLP